MPKFKSGEIVRVRSLQSMIDEYGTDEDYECYPKVQFGFNDEMAELCGTTATVTGVDSRGRVSLVDSDGSN